MTLQDYKIKMIAIPYNGKVERLQVVPVQALSPDSAMLKATSYYKEDSYHHIIVFDDMGNAVRKVEKL